MSNVCKKPDVFPYKKEETMLDVFIIKTSTENEPPQAIVALKNKRDWATSVITAQYHGLAAICVGNKVNPKEDLTQYLYCFYTARELTDADYITIHLGEIMPPIYSAILQREKYNTEGDIEFAVRTYVGTMICGYKMTAFSAVCDFMNAKTKTYAHIDGVVPDEMMKFSDMKEAVKRDANTKGYPILAYKLLNPNGELLTMAKVKTLRFCSIYWKSLGSESWRNFKGVENDADLQSYKKLVEKQIELSNITKISAKQRNKILKLF